MKKVMFAVVAVVVFASCEKEEMVETKESKPVVEQNTSNNTNNLQKADDEPDIEIIYDGVYAECVDGGYCIPPENACAVIVHGGMSPVNDNTNLYTGAKGVKFTHFKGDEKVTRYFDHLVVTKNPTAKQLFPSIDPKEEVLSQIRFGKEL